MKYCPQCGKPVKDGAKFCPNCGKQLSQLQLSNSTNSKTESSNSHAVHMKNASLSKTIPSRHKKKVIIPSVIAAVAVIIIISVSLSHHSGSSDAVVAESSTQTDKFASGANTADKEDDSVQDSYDDTIVTNNSESESAEQQTESSNEELTDQASAPGTSSGDEEQDNNQLQGTVLFDQNGITAVLTSADTIHVENQNPDNRSFYMYMLDIAYNNIIINGQSTTADLLAGESTDMLTGYDETRYYSAMAEFGPEFDNIPIESITYVFAAKIGRDGDEQIITKEFHLSGYNEEDLAIYTSYKLGDYANGALTAYRIDPDNGLFLLIENNSGKFIREGGGPFDYESWLINGERVEDVGGNWNGGQAFAEGLILPLYLNETADHYRKIHEISNTVPLKVRRGVITDIGTFDIDCGELQ